MQLLPLMYSSKSVHSLGSPGCGSRASPRLFLLPFRAGSSSVQLLPQVGLEASWSGRRESEDPAPKFRAG